MARGAEAATALLVSFFSNSVKRCRSCAGLPARYPQLAQSAFYSAVGSLEFDSHKSNGLAGFQKRAELRIILSGPRSF